MGYRVEYGPVGAGRMEHRKSRGHWLLPGIGFFLLFVVLTCMFWPQGREVLQEVLLPGDPAVTAAALENLAEELKMGESVSTALEGFCREIVVNGSAGTY